MPIATVYRPAPVVRKARFQTAPFGPAKSLPDAVNKAKEEAKPAAAVVVLENAKAAPGLKKA